MVAQTLSSTGISFLTGFHPGVPASSEATCTALCSRRQRRPTLPARFFAVETRSQSLSGISLLSEIFS